MIHEFHLKFSIESEKWIRIFVEANKSIFFCKSLKISRIFYFVSVVFVRKNAWFLYFYVLLWTILSKYFFQCRCKIEIIVRTESFSLECRTTWLVLSVPATASSRICQKMIFCIFKFIHKALHFRYKNRKSHKKKFLRGMVRTKLKNF